MKTYNNVVNTAVTNAQIILLAALIAANTAATITDDIVNTAIDDIISRAGLDVGMVINTRRSRRGGRPSYRHNVPDGTSSETKLTLNDAVTLSAFDSAAERDEARSEKDAEKETRKAQNEARKAERRASDKALKARIAGAFAPNDTISNRALRRANGERGKGVKLMPVEHEVAKVADYTAEMAERIAKLANRAWLRNVVRDAAIAEAAKLPGIVRAFREAGMAIGQLRQLRRVVFAAAAGNVKQLRIYAKLLEKREAALGGQFADGTKWFVHPDGHIHEMTIAAEAAKRIVPTGTFCRNTVECDHVIGRDHLVETTKWDLVYYTTRGKRQYESRMVVGREAPETKVATLVACIATEPMHLAGQWVPVSAFAGHQGLREVGNFSRDQFGSDAYKAAVEFWRTHALVPTAEETAAWAPVLRAKLDAFEAELAKAEKMEAALKKAALAGKKVGGLLTGWHRKAHAARRPVHLLRKQLGCTVTSWTVEVGEWNDDYMEEIFKTSSLEDAVARAREERKAWGGDGSIEMIDCRMNVLVERYVDGYIDVLDAVEAIEAEEARQQALAEVAIATPMPEAELTDEPTAEPATENELDEYAIPETTIRCGNFGAPVEEAVRDLVHGLTNAELGRLINKLAARLWPTYTFAYEYADMNEDGVPQFFSFKADNLGDAVVMEAQDRGFGFIAVYDKTERPFIYDRAFCEFSFIIDEACRWAQHEDFVNVLETALCKLYTILLERRAAESMWAKDGVTFTGDVIDIDVDGLNELVVPVTHIKEGTFAAPCEEELPRGYDSENCLAYAPYDPVHFLTEAELGRLINKLAAKLWPGMRFMYDYDFGDGTLAKAVSEEWHDYARAFFTIFMFDGDTSVPDDYFNGLRSNIDNWCKLRSSGRAVTYKTLVMVYEELVKQLFTILLDRRAAEADSQEENVETYPGCEMLIRISRLVHGMTNEEYCRLINKLGEQLWPYAAYKYEYVYSYMDDDDEEHEETHCIPANTLADAVAMKVNDLHSGSIIQCSEVYDKSFDAFVDGVNDDCRRGFFGRIYENAFYHLYVLLLRRRGNEGSDCQDMLEHMEAETEPCFDCPDTIDVPDIEIRVPHMPVVYTETNSVVVAADMIPEPLGNYVFYFGADTRVIPGTGVMLYAKYEHGVQVVWATTWAPSDATRVVNTLYNDGDYVGRLVPPEGTNAPQPVTVTVVGCTEDADEEEPVDFFADDLMPEERLLECLPPEMARKAGCENALDEYSLPETVIRDGRFSAPTNTLVELDEDFDGEMLNCVEPWATMFATERALIRTPRARFSAQVARAAARDSSYEDFRREVRQLDMNCELEELTQAVIDNSDLFVDSRGRVFTEEDALELDEMARPVIHIPGSVFAGDEPAPIENIAKADEAEAFSTADQMAAGSAAHVQEGGKHMSENNAPAAGCVQIREVLGWNHADGRPGIFNVALANFAARLKETMRGLGPVPVTLSDWAAAYEQEAAHQAEIMLGDEGAFFFSTAADACRLTPMKNCAALRLTEIRPDGHFETGWLRLRHEVRRGARQIPDLPRPDDALFDVRESGDDGSVARYYEAVEKLEKALCERLVYAGMTDGKRHYRIYCANAADLKAGKCTLIEDNLYEAHSEALNWGRTEEQWSRAGINGTELFKLRALMLTPSTDDDAPEIDLDKIAIVFNPEKTIHVKQAYWVEEDGSVRRIEDAEYSQTLWDGQAMFIGSPEQLKASQFRGIIPDKGVVSASGTIEEMKAAGLDVQDEIQVWGGWDENGKPIMKAKKVENGMFIMTESTVKGLKLFDSTEDVADYVRKYGQGRLLRIVRTVEAVQADEEEVERRKASRSMMLSLVAGHPANYAKLAARTARKIEKLLDAKHLFDELSEAWKPDEEKSGLALLLAGAGEAAMELTNRKGEKFIQQLANDRFLELYKRSAISPSLGGGKYKAEYLYICHDRQAMIEYFLCGKPLEECGYLKAGEVGAPHFKNREIVYIARHPMNAPQQCIGVVKNNPLFAECGNFIELSIHDDFINRMDGDFDGDEAFITNDPVWVKMNELMLNKLGLFGILFKHGKGNKYAITIPPAVDIMFGDMANGEKLWQSCSRTVWNGMEFNIVGTYANYAAKIMNGVDAVELYKLMQCDPEAALAKLEDEYKLMRAVLCHVITILAIDSMKTEKAPEDACKAVAEFAGEYQRMPYTQRFVNGSCRPSTIYEDGSEDPADGCEYPFWSQVWGNAKAVNSRGKKVHKTTAKMGRSGADIYCCSFMQHVTRDLRERFHIKMDRAFFEDVAHYRVYIGEIAALSAGKTLPTFKWTLLYDNATFEDGCEWNRVTNGRNGFPKIRKASLPAGHQRNEFVALLRGRGLANEFDKGLVDSIERGEPFGIDALLKLLHHQKAKLAMENADDKARSVDARIDIGIQTRVALSIVRTFLELRDENGQLFQPWLEKYSDGEGHLDDRALRSLANTMIRFIMDSSADPHEGRHGFFGFLLDLFGGIWGENAQKNRANEELAKKILESSELRAELEEDPEAEAVTETPDPDWAQLFVPAEAEDYSAPEQPAPAAQAVSHTTTTEGGSIMNVTIINNNTAATNTVDVPVISAEQARDIAKAFGPAMGFVAQNGTDYLAIVATSVTAEAKAAITAGVQKHGWLYAWGPKGDKANTGKTGTDQPQQPAAEQPVVQQQPAVSMQPDNPVNNGAFKAIVVGAQGFEALDVVERVCDHAFSTVGLSKKITVLDWRADGIGSKYAIKNGVHHLVYHPDFSGCTGLTGRDLMVIKAEAAKERNKVMVADANAIIAFWDGQDKGVAHLIRLSMNAGLPIKVYDLNGQYRTVAVNGANMLAMYDAQHTPDTSVSKRAADAIAATKPAPEPAAAPAVEDMGIVNDRINAIIDVVRAIDSNHGGQLRKIITKLDDKQRRSVLELMEKRDTVALAAMKKGFGSKILASIEKAVININNATK